jgi:hypothetical protein
MSKELNSTGEVKINLQPVVDLMPLDFTSVYQNSSGEDYTIKTFRFYIHKIELLNSNTAVSNIQDNHFLIDAQDHQTLSIKFRALASTYNSIAFTIGIDSIYNFSGAQSGVLDPARGMFWTWSTGYIMAKFEGASPISNQPGNRFEYHIGGFKDADNVVKRIELPFPPGLTLTTAHGKTAKIDITADANKWFDGNSLLTIATNPVCMTPGSLAKKIAENYYHMFTVINVENN